MATNFYPFVSQPRRHPPADTGGSLSPLPSGWWFVQFPERARRDSIGEPVGVQPPIDFAQEKRSETGRSEAKVTAAPSAACLRTQNGLVGRKADANPDAKYRRDNRRNLLSENHLPATRGERRTYMTQKNTGP